MDERGPVRRNTAARRAMLDILKKSGRPLSAPEVHERLRENGGKQSLSTVYRALDSFAEAGVLLKQTLGDAARFQVNGGLHTHFAVCTRCGRTAPLKGCPLSPVQVEGGFEVKGHSLELFGICGECKKDSGG